METGELQGGLVRICRGIDHFDDQVAGFVVFTGDAEQFG